MLETPQGILFVCLGNICRSPLAEAVARKKFSALGLDIPLESAGTGNWHVGGSADPRARAVAQRHGYDLDSHRARQLELDDFERFSLVVGMDASNLSHIKTMQPATAAAQVGLMLTVAGLGQGREVPDPYFGADAGFEDCLRLLEDGVDGLIAQMGCSAGDAPRPV